MSTTLNKEIAARFRLLAKLLELYDENPFKIRSYQNAAYQIERLPVPLDQLDVRELATVKGIGPAIQKKIRDILETGTLPLLDKYLEKTPDGVLEMLSIKGLGGKKAGIIWRELGIESPGELLYACQENRLALLKGFGTKTQENVRRQLEYYLVNRGKRLYAEAEAEAREIINRMTAAIPGLEVQVTGALRRREILVDELEFLLKYPEPGLAEQLDALHLFENRMAENGHISAVTPVGTKVRLYLADPDNSGYLLLKTTGDDAFLKAWPVPLRPGSAEADYFRKAGLPYIAPELRNGTRWLEKAKKNQLPRLVERKDLRGVIHWHTTWSDGLNTLEEMALACRDAGYEYAVVSDHSRSAFYANGLDIERLKAQQEQIRELNDRLAPFRLFSSIEADILSDGNLDYPDEVLTSFDLVIASVHSNLRMPMEKAMERLLRAIANPYTRILGHLTGRILLSREGYPVDHEEIIRACAEHNIVIELNANPNRLDIDWKWLPMAAEAGVLISINPDAHHVDGLEDVRYGIYAARKGGLEARHVLNAKPLPEFTAWIQQRR